MKKICLCLLLTAALTMSASALEVPTNTVVQNLNGSQQVVKTYTVSPEVDAQTLIEEPFQLEGFLYTYADIVKEENRVSERQTHTETVTVETAKKNLDVILKELAPTMEYDDGAWAGTLALDHTSIQTQAAGYTTGSSTVTATKTIGPLDRNDMSYVPATTTKNGVTLNLSNVEWQVIGADVVGDVMAPCSYQAVATYSGKSYYKAATGYVTTANYVGEVTHEGVESVTYQVTYLGKEYEPEPSPASEEGQPNLLQRVVSSPNFLRNVLGGAGVITAVVLTVLLILSRREVKSLRSEDGETDDEQEESGT
nr:hypothetical protein [uncultured Oscillibacter sp.]